MLNYPYIPLLGTALAQIAQLSRHIAQSLGNDNHHGAGPSCRAEWPIVGETGRILQLYLPCCDSRRLGR